jgi:hypothetical protein
MNPATSAADVARFCPGPFLRASLLAATMVQSLVVAGSCSIFIALRRVILMALWLCQCLPML